ncbi:MAG: hypothetical protein K0T99_02435 [Alphaproteobacteria bacterium]|nr:hypothetical protein [Alphaproteobacteria bacterium]
MEKIRDEVNPFTDFGSFLYEKFYKQPQNFFYHSLDDLTEDVIKGFFMYGAYTLSAVYGGTLCLNVFSAVAGYAIGNYFGDWVGELTETIVKYSIGSSKESDLDDLKALSFAEFMGDVTEDIVKVVGLVDLLKLELGIYGTFTRMGTQDAHVLVKALTVVSAISKFIESYYDWNEYSNKVGHFFERHVTEFFNSADILDDIEAYGQDTCLWDDAI